MCLINLDRSAKEIHWGKDIFLTYSAGTIGYPYAE